MILLQWSAWLQQDSVKIAIFLGFVAAFFIVAKWSSATSESSANQNDFATVDQPHYIEAPEPPVFQAPVVDRHAEAPMHPEMRYGDVLIRGLNFASFDALSGPADPGCFCDEILLDLENLSSGHTYMMSHVVATPEGLRKALADKRWEIMYLPTVYVVSRYDLTLIRDTIMGVGEEGEDSLEEFNPAPDQEPKSVFGSGRK
jgi:hypothetical protein